MKTEITIDQRAIVAPHDNMVRTKVAYQKENYRNRPRGYYLEVMAFTKKDGSESYRISFGGDPDQSFHSTTLIETAARFSAKRLQELAVIETAKFTGYPTLTEAEPSAVSI